MIVFPRTATNNHHHCGWSWIKGKHDYENHNLPTCRPVTRIIWLDPRHRWPVAATVVNSTRRRRRRLCGWIVPTTQWSSWLLVMFRDAPFDLANGWVTTISTSMQHYHVCNWCQFSRSFIEDWLGSTGSYSSLIIVTLTKCFVIREPAKFELLFDNDQPEMYKTAQLKNRLGQLITRYDKLLYPTKSSQHSQVSVSKKASKSTNWVLFTSYTTSWTPKPQAWASASQAQARAANPRLLLLWEGLFQQARHILCHLATCHS